MLACTQKYLEEAEQYVHSADEKRALELIEKRALELMWAQLAETAHLEQHISACFSFRFRGTL